MNYKPEDLEILVITYNRAKMLDETLESIKNQTLQGFRVLVVDNCSSDKTMQVVEKYGFDFFKSPENIGQVKNFDKAIELAERKWTMIFHDDDLIHPEYLEKTLKIINTYPDLSMVSGLYNTKEKLENQNWTKLNNKTLLLKTAGDLAQFIIAGKPFSFSGCLCRTDLLKKISISNDLYLTYGKIFDKPFMFDMAKNGAVCVILDKSCVRYRVHEGQDTGNPETGPFAEQIISMHRYFYELLHKNSLIYKISFFLRNHKMLMNSYNWIHPDKKPPLEEFLNECLKQNASTKSSIIAGILRKNFLFLPVRGILQGLLELNFMFKTNRTKPL